MEHSSWRGDHYLPRQEYPIATRLRGRQGFKGTDTSPFYLACVTQCECGVGEKIVAMVEWPRELSAKEILVPFNTRCNQNCNLEWLISDSFSNSRGRILHAIAVTGIMQWNPGLGDTWGWLLRRPGEFPCWVVPFAGSSLTYFSNAGSAIRHPDDGKFHYSLVKRRPSDAHWLQ